MDGGRVVACAVARARASACCGGSSETVTGPGRTGSRSATYLPTSRRRSTPSPTASSRALVSSGATERSRATPHPGAGRAKPQRGQHPRLPPSQRKGPSPCHTAAIAPTAASAHGPLEAAYCSGATGQCASVGTATSARTSSARRTCFENCDAPLLCLPMRRSGVRGCGASSGNPGFLCQLDPVCSAHGTHRIPLSETVALHSTVADRNLCRWYVAMGYVPLQTPKITPISGASPSSASANEARVAVACLIAVWDGQASRSAPSCAAIGFAIP
jgi:hypothetical protein